MVHNRDNEGIDVAHEIISPKHQPQFSHTAMEQYCLDKIMPKTCFQVDPKYFSIVSESLKGLLMKFSTD